MYVHVFVLFMCASVCVLVLVWDSANNPHLFTASLSPHAGPCNETTPCNAGLCFVNATGCPFSGYHQVKVALTSNSSSPGGWNEEEDSLMYFHACAMSVMFIFLSVPLLLLCIYLTSHR